MGKPDLTLIHPPTHIEFPKIKTIYGPISDVIPSTPIFEMYPIGYATILNYLEECGYHVHIINLAVLQLNKPKLNVEKFLAKIDSQAFGVDLHWLAHAKGALTLTKILRRLHPNRPIILGGLTATYYHGEIMETNPQIDYILLGDSTEKPLKMLLDKIESNKKPENIPNLVWRNEGKIKINSITYIPRKIDEFKISFKRLLKKCLEHLKPSYYYPWKDWLKYPLTAVFPFRGCTQNCTICGGSKYAFKKVCHRTELALKSPETIVEEMREIRMLLKAPIFIVGDIRTPGIKYAQKLLETIKRESVEGPVVFELFYPMPKKLIRQIESTVDEYYMEITPESANLNVRLEARGYSYTNKHLEKMVDYALKHGCERFDIFYSIGLPKQTMETIMQTHKYMENLYETFNPERIAVFMAPIAPYLDPGSIAYENPLEKGYKIKIKTLSEYAANFGEGSWINWLNYETKWLNLRQIEEATYQTAIKLSEIRAKHGLATQNQLEKTREIIAQVRAGKIPKTKELAGSRIISTLTQLLWPTKTYIKPLSIIRCLL